MKIGNSYKIGSLYKAGEHILEVIKKTKRPDYPYEIIILSSDDNELLNWNPDKAKEVVYLGMKEELPEYYL